MFDVNDDAKGEHAVALRFSRDLAAGGAGRRMRRHGSGGSVAGQTTTQATPRFIPIVSEAIPSATVQRAVSAASRVEVKLAVRVSSGVDDAAQFTAGVARGSGLGIPIMINVPADARVLLATRPIDFRKGAHSSRRPGAEGTTG
jgi:hypothetical protein